MKNDICLVRPTLEHREEALAYREEHFRHGENIIYGSELFDKTESYEEWLTAVTRNTDPATVNENWVVTDTFFAVRKGDGRIVGIIDLRHTLNDFLKDLGNCGYSVRPSERRKGYATEMLHQLLRVAKEVGLKELHISVEKENTASIKVIKKNGGACFVRGSCGAFGDVAAYDGGRFYCGVLRRRAAGADGRDFAGHVSVGAESHIDFYGVVHFFRNYGGAVAAGGGVFLVVVK